MLDMPPATTDEGRPPRAAVVVVSYGSSELLREALGAWEDEQPGDPLLVVVDNFSGVREQQRVAELGRACGWTVVLQPGNPGFGAAVNRGVEVAREAGCDAVLLLNPDARVDRRTAAELIAHVRTRPAELVAPRIVDSSGGLYSAGSVVYRDSGRIRSVGRPVPSGSTEGAAVRWVSGACLGVHLDLWDRVGGLAEDLFLYWEDVDLSLRVQAAGGDVAVRDDLEAVHDEGGTQQRRGVAKSALYYRWNCRNRLVVGARSLGRRDLLRWVVATPSVTREVLLRGGRRQLLSRPQLAWSAVRGSLEGLGPALHVLSGRRPGRPRVLLVHPSADLYGSDRVFLESVVAVAGRADVVVLLPETGPLADRLRAHGVDVRVQPLPALRKQALRPGGMAALVWVALRTLPRSVALVATAGRDAVYVSTTILPTWVLLARALGRRTVLHVHEAESTWSAARARLLVLPARAAHVVVANSSFTAQVLLRAAPGLGDRLRVVANPVPAPVPVPARASISGDLRLAYVGRLSPRKGPHVAIEVVRELARRGQPARLELVGSTYPGYEWYEEQLRADVHTSGLGDRVTFSGFQPRVDVVHARADIALVPSLVDESFGNVAVEAVLIGRPVVVSDSGGLVEAVRGCRSARVAPPGDAVAWADALVDLTEDWAATRAAAQESVDLLRARHDTVRYRGAVRTAVLGERS